MYVKTCVDCTNPPYITGSLHFAPQTIITCNCHPILAKLANCTLHADWLLKLIVTCKLSELKKGKFLSFPLHGEIKNYPH